MPYIFNSDFIFMSFYIHTLPRTCDKQTTPTVFRRRNVLDAWCQPCPSVLVHTCLAKASVSIFLEEQAHIGGANLSAHSLLCCLSAFWPNEILSSINVQCKFLQAKGNISTHRIGRRLFDWTIFVFPLHLSSLIR